MRVLFARQFVLEYGEDHGAGNEREDDRFEQRRQFSRQSDNPAGDNADSQYITTVFIVLHRKLPPHIMGDRHEMRTDRDAVEQSLNG